MPALVEYGEPGAPGHAQINSGDPVRGPTWASFARALNYLLGTSRTLVPWCSPNALIFDGDPARALKFKVFPSYQASHRVWHVALGHPAMDEFAGGTVTFTDPSGGTSTLTLTDARPTTWWVIEHTETVASRTNAETELAPTIEVAGGDVVVIGLACIEAPRKRLMIDEDDLGLEVTSYRGYFSPILGGVTGHSLGAVPGALAAALARNRRALLAWAAPEEAPWSTTSTSYTDVHRAEVLERFLYRAETAPTCTARVLAWVSGGTGDVQITTAAGSVSATVSATTPTWHTLSPDIAAEDMSEADGRRSGADVLTVQARKNTSGTIYVAGIGVWGRAS